MRLVKPSYEIWDRSGDLLELVERAGRVCYQSDPKGDPEGFVKRLITRRHFSVLEHAWFAATGWDDNTPPFMEFDEERQLLLGNARAWQNAVRHEWCGMPRGLSKQYYVLLESGKPESSYLVRHSIPDGLVFTVNFTIDRGVSHELVRHRPPSFSQESTRYCNYGGGVTFVIPPWLDIVPTELGPNGWLNRVGPLETWLQSLCQAESYYLDLLRLGWNPQQARSVLPNSLKTQIVVTAYWKEWQIIFALRCAESAHPQMREVMVPLQHELAEKYPDKFGDVVIQSVREGLE